MHRIESNGHPTGKRFHSLGGRIWSRLPGIWSEELETRPSGGICLVSSTTQPRNLASCVLCDTPSEWATNAKDLEIKIALRKLCAEELLPWEFSQHMAIYNMIRRVLFKNHSMRPSLTLLRDTHISKNSHRLRSPSHPQSGAIRYDRSNSNCNPSISKVF
jgi:hypothetical protein